jgi:hypothetical protein
MMRISQTGRFPVPNGGRRAALNPGTLNVLILACVALIGVTYLIGILSKGPEKLANVIWVLFALVVLFLILDILVYARLSPSLREAIARRAMSGIGKAFVSAAASLGLLLAIAVFFLATCFAMIQVF